ncbi:hypothetical protein [Cyclobacterium sp.]|uniref:hypothetical protein n=1 Tax=Cyclobacterium sp. TaxID=1966343 RepID=UPI001999193D|nr:hypothetical protein [Cyclobacterium sp.]MBD3631283.1 hypothetical protein [Cyclobacterium sp.]
MRPRFEAQLTLGCTPVEEVKIPTKTRSHMAALQYIYITPKWNEQVFAVLSEKITQGRKATGRKGMSLWEIFALGQVRLCMNTSYDELHYNMRCFPSILMAPKISYASTGTFGSQELLPGQSTSGKLYS